MTAAELLPVDAYRLASRESWLGVKLTRAEFDKLLAYDCSIPTGVIIGKKWRRSDRDGHWVGEYVRRACDCCGVEVVFRPVIFIDEATPPGERGPS